MLSWIDCVRFFETCIKTKKNEHALLGPYRGEEVVLEGVHERYGVFLGNLLKKTVKEEAF